MHTFWDDVQWMLRDTSPFALIVAGLTLTSLVMYRITRWREFMVVGVTMGVYLVPFLLTGRH
jgi:hypothetical protein